MLFCLTKESPSLDKKEARLLKENHKKIVNEGRNPNLKIYDDKGEAGVSELANNLLEEMNSISEESREFVFEEKNNRWSESLKKQKEKIEDLNLTPSGKVIERLISDNLSHEELGMEIAEKNLAFFENYNNSREEEFKREASLSKEQQKKLESQKGPPFEEYLAEFLNKVS